MLCNTIKMCAVEVRLLSDFQTLCKNKTFSTSFTVSTRNLSYFLPIKLSTQLCWFLVPNAMQCKHWEVVRWFCYILATRAHSVFRRIIKIQRPTQDLLKFAVSLRNTVTFWLFWKHSKLFQNDSDCGLFCWDISITDKWPKKTAQLKNGKFWHKKYCQRELANYQKTGIFHNICQIRCLFWYYVFWYPAVAHIFIHLVNLAFGPKLSFKSEC